MRQTIRTGLVVTIVGAVLGLWFASMSTADFARHLDRQVHDVHCSFVPGLAGPEQGESGCQVTLVSQYSSIWRTAVWGGVPISLPAMAVFAFLLFFAAELWLTGRQDNPKAAAFLVAATGLPVLASIIMGYLSLVELDAVCKLCIGIYLASALSFGGAVSLFLRARREATGSSMGSAAPSARKPRARSAHEPAWAAPGAASAAESEPEPEPVASSPRPALSGPEPTPTSWQYLAGAFGVGVVFVLAPVLSYLIAAPDHSGFIGECGALPTAGDEYGIMVPLDSNPRGAPAVEVLDPLCPACRGFERALESSGFDDRLDRRAVLFPLDNTCNWMVDAAVHPGACTVSYAVLCAKDWANAVLEWAFEYQEAIREATASDVRAAERMVVQRFPELARCVRSQAVKARLNRSLRWAVANRLPVLTPQLYVGGAKLCDEDVDLGLEFALSRLLEAYEDGSLAAKVAEAAKQQSAQPAAFEQERRTAQPLDDPESETESETETETETESETESESETETETDSESESETESEADAAESSASETKPRARPAAEPKGDVDSDFEPDPDPAVDTDFEPDPEPAVDSDFEPDPGPGAPQEDVEEGAEEGAGQAVEEATEEPAP